MLDAGTNWNVDGQHQYSDRRLELAMEFYRKDYWLTVLCETFDEKLSLTSNAGGFEESGPFCEFGYLHMARLVVFITVCSGIFTNT